MENSESRVKMQGNLTDPFKPHLEINQVLKQGDGLAQMLFNLALVTPMLHCYTNPPN